MQLRMRKDEMARLEALAKEEVGRRLVSPHPATVTPPDAYDRTTWSGTAHLALDIGLAELERRVGQGRTAPSRPPLFLVPFVKGEDLHDPASARGLMCTSRSADTDPRLGYEIYTSPFDGGMLDFVPLSLFYMGPSPGPRLVSIGRGYDANMLPAGLEHGIPLENFDRIRLPDQDHDAKRGLRIFDGAPVMFPNRVHATITGFPVGVTTFRMWVVATTIG
jgi:hypothetical protein